MIVTESANFEPLEQLNIVLAFRGECDSPEAHEMHRASGLLDECAASTITLSDALIAAAGWISRHGGGKPIMSGSSIHFDVEWIKAYAPSFLELFHYRRIDVSGVNELLKTQGAGLEGPKDKAHRSIADLFNSINLARHCVSKLCVA